MTPPPEDRRPARPGPPRPPGPPRAPGQPRRVAPPSRGGRPAPAPTRSGRPTPRPANVQRPVAKAAPARPKVRRRRKGLRLGLAGRRLTFGFGTVVLLLGVVGGRLVQLQGVDPGDYARAAAAERLRTLTIHAARGEIVDRNGVVLAYTGGAKDVIADPSQVPVAERLVYALKLAPLLDRPVDKVVALLSQGNRYAMLGQAVAPGQASQIADLDLAGIYLEATTQRLYPGGTTAANVIGLVHSDGTGAAGIEQQYDELLSGRDGSKTYELDARGNVNPNGYSRSVGAVNGGTVTLTLSQDLQYMVQTELDAMVKASGARGGQICVMDVHGNILALATSNTFNSADPSTIKPNTMLNAPVQSVFEPGSVNKVVAISAALEEGKINPLTTISVPDSIRMGGVTVHDAWWHPTQKMTATGILAESSNVGALKIAQMVGPTTWDKYAKLYGQGERTGIELPGESAGILPDMKDWSGSTFSNLPIGQGVAVTIVQMTSMYQAIANDGVRIPPRIVASTTAPDGTVTNTEQPAGVRVISAKTAQTLRTMLESTMMPDGGTGVKAAVPGYRIAGKTGTAQQPDPKTGKYSDSMYWDTFTGIAPADNPQFIIGIMIDNPAHGVHGGDVAAPVFHDIAAYQLQHAGIAPSGSKTKVVPFVVP